MPTLEVFDRPMCCSSGVCGPKVDKTLVEFAAAAERLRARGVNVQRYNPTQQYDAFVARETVVQVINDKGLECLPLILVNGQIVHQGEYPSPRELARLVGMDAGDIS